MARTRSDPVARAEDYYRSGAYAKAAIVLKPLIRKKSQEPRVLRLLGMCRLRLGDTTGALQMLEQAHSQAPDDPYIRLHYGIGLHETGRHREAAEQFAACRDLLPEDPAPFLNLASALLALGESMRALDAARRARRRAPEMPQTHYTLGLALLACRRFDEAAEAFTATLKRAPDFADAWVNLGVARYRANRIEDAKAAMRRALGVAPGHRAAAANLGAFLRLTGESEAGEALLRDLVVRDPAATEARLNLAAALLQEERGSEALALLGEQPPLNAAAAQSWRLQRSLALLLCGRVSEARSLVTELGDVPPPLRPLLLWRRVLLAQADRDDAVARQFAEEMAAALDAGVAIVPEHRIMAHFDLARFWSQRREPRRAFAGWREGHRLLGLLQPFSRAVSRAVFDANIAQFDRVRLHYGARAQNRDSAPVFIVGMPRSGTTLAEQIVASHPQVFGAGERPALGRSWYRLGSGEGPASVARIAALDPSALDQNAADYLAELHALAPNAARIVDKMPGNFNYLGLAALMLPGARIIHCVRDPRDIGLSIFTFRFYGYHPYAHDIGDLGWYIGQHDRLMAHWREVLPNPILTVRLRDWVEDFLGTLQRVLDFLDLPYDPACERFYEQTSRVRTVSRSQVRQPVNARGLGRWLEYAEELQPLIAELQAGGVVLTD